MTARTFLRRHWKPLLGAAVLGSVACHPHLAQAASTGGGSLPWDTPLTTLRNDITGPVAFTVSLLGIVAAGAALVFGGEINEFTRRIMMLVLVVSFVVAATNFATALGITGAIV
jgi:type IV secretion system protein VirB2